MEHLVLRSVGILMASGFFLMFQDSILYQLRMWLWPLRKQLQCDSRLHIHLRRLFLVVTNGKHVEEKLAAFEAATTGSFLIFGCLMWKSLGWKGILPAALIASIPYAYVRVQIHIRQIHGSFEGERLVDELLNQYKIHDHNMYAAIDACVLKFDDSSISKRAMLRLAIRMKTFESEAQLREALKDFTANWDTVWAAMIADNIQNAVLEQVDVIQGLEYILKESREAGKKIEKNKRENMTAEAVVNILCPLFFFVLLWMAKSMMDYDWATIFHYEFGQPQGLLIFAAILLLAGFNMVCFPLIGKQKYDI